MKNSIIYTLLLAVVFLMSCDPKKSQTPPDPDVKSETKYFPGFILASAQELYNTGIVRIKLDHNHFSSTLDHIAPSLIYKYEGMTFDTYEDVWFKIKKEGSIAYASEVTREKPSDEELAHVDSLKAFINDGHAINIHSMNVNHDEDPIHRAGHFPNYSGDLGTAGNRLTFNSKSYFKSEFHNTNGSKIDLWIPVPNDSSNPLYVITKSWVDQSTSTTYNIGTYLTNCNWHVGSQDPFCSF